MKLTAAQRLALEVLVRDGGEVECGKRRSQHGPRPRVNTNAVHNLSGMGLARMHLSYGFRVKYSATDAGRELVRES